MSVITAAHAVLLDHRKKLGDAVLHKDGRVVQKQNLLLLAKPRRVLQGGADAAGLAGNQLFVVLLPLLKHPPAGAAQADSLGADGVVVQDGQRVKAALLQKAVHLGFGGPPIIVVALHQNLFAGQGVQESKVRLCLLQAHPPGDIPGDHHRVLLADHRAPVLFQALHVIFPPAKDVHRLVHRQRQVGISYDK